MAVALVTRTIRRLAGLEEMPQPPLIRLRHPVVLMHGFGLLAGIKRHGHLHQEAMWLRGHGVWAYAPNVVPYQTVAVRSAMWEQRLHRVLVETGAQKLHLIAHSMGGLDARYLISVLGYHTHVATLTTISTPHHGASLAQIALEAPTLLLDPAVGFTNWLGSSAFESGFSNVVDSLHELTPAAITERFNPAAPDHPGVVYRSYAGRAGRGTNVPISPALYLQNALIHAREGINDGIVATDSARWGSFEGYVDADHAAQVGLRVGL
ncbi:MAG TPA: lipase, partial [Rhodothermales bacterium]|nr:lipase [Rhodothermales bacterium]